MPQLPFLELEMPSFSLEIGHLKSLDVRDLLQS